MCRDSSDCRPMEKSSMKESSMEKSSMEESSVEEFAWTESLEKLTSSVRGTDGNYQMRKE
ncbi:hypothetical protein E2C01_048493 [Portunus trituberculatus]|uniref:Uncharacterized protein n=1 Tax=Portunus trituberculatus TaxID=210409 RepID=A0A5B7G6K2_PORTR|nr:hypothetical protein [Portunus trituberculatus]